MHILRTNTKLCVRLVLVVVFGGVLYVGLLSPAVKDITATNRADDNARSSECWVHRRKELLTSPSAPKKVLLFTYMKGGSSLVGEVFNRDPGAVYWYEPVAGFAMSYYGFGFGHLPHQINYHRDLQTRISFSPKEQGWLTDFFYHIYHCHYERLPSVSWMHPFITFSKSNVAQSLKDCVHDGDRLRLIKKCNILAHVCVDMETSRAIGCADVIHATRRTLANVPTRKLDRLKASELVDLLDLTDVKTRPQLSVKHLHEIAEHVLCTDNMHRQYAGCLRDADAMCQRADLHVAKVHRMKVEDLEQILRAIPDLHVVYYVRDPRAIAASRLGTGGLKVGTEFLKEAEFLCRRIRVDLAHKADLEKRFPGVFLDVRYEDLVLDPSRTAEDIYQYIGRDLSDGWLEFSKRAFYSDKETKTSKVNGTLNIDKWRNGVSESDVERVNEMCKDVLDSLGYDSI